MPNRNLHRTIQGKYRLDSILGQGAMGVVYRATQIGLGGDEIRAVAVKMVRPDLSVDDKAMLVERFLGEVRAAARLTSPYSVNVHDYGQLEDGCLFYVMELVEGLTLKDVLADGRPLAHAQICEITEQVATALKEAHEFGIVHRDLKPSNLFLAGWPEEVHAKIGDFGIAKDLRRARSDLTAPGSIVGTPLYMSPEQCQDGDVDGRSDLYSLGVILFEMIAGSPPFSGDCSQLTRKHLHEPAPPFSEGVHPELAKLVGELLAKRPSDRPLDAQSVRHRIRRLRRAAGGNERGRRADSECRIVASRYRLLDLLGSGPLGRLYRAARVGEAGADPADVALRLLEIDRESVSRATLLGEFLREARRAAQLADAHIVRVIDFGTDDGAAYFATQLVQAPTLLSVLRRDRVTQSQAVAIARQICRALEKAHGAGVVHHELHPKHVFVDRLERSPHVEVKGFGFDRVLGQEGGGPALTQPSCYLAPEQWRGERMDARTDLYSLGCILHEMISGSPPFGRNLIIARMGHLEDLPPPATGAPQALQELITRLLAKRAEDRPADASEVARALDEIASAPPTASSGGSRSSPHPEPAEAPTLAPQGRRSLRAVVLGALLSLLGLATFGYLLLSSSR